MKVFSIYTGLVLLVDKVRGGYNFTRKKERGIIKMKKSALLFSMLLFLGITGCTNNSTTSNASSSLFSSTTSSQENQQRYTITFENCDFEDLVVVEGTSFAKPNDPIAEEGYLFDGWYLDAQFIQEATFPLIIQSNVVLYAKFSEIKEYFLEAREKTLSNGYTYTDHLNVTTSILGIAGPQALREGTISKRNDGDLTYKAHYLSSGLLLVDGEEYILERLGNKETIRLNEDGHLTKYEVERLEDVKDGSVYAKAIFEYASEDIEKVIDSGNGLYEIKTTANTSSVISSTLSILGSSFVQGLISVLPEVGNTFTMFVTFDDGYIDTYTYEFEIEVASTILNFAYSLDFNQYNETSALVPPTFDNVLLGQNEINQEINETVKTIYTNYKDLNPSSYSYELDVVLENEDQTFDTNVKGKTIRTNQNETIYFNNKISLNTNFDEYYEDVENYEIYRANLLNGEVYNAIDRTWPLSNEYHLSTSRNEIDAYYLFLDVDFYTISNINALEKETNQYHFVLNQNGVVELLNLFEAHTYILKEDANKYSPFGNYDSNKLILEEAFLIISFDEQQQLEEITLEVSGDIDSQFVNFESSTYDFTLMYNLKVESISTYEIPETTDDIELS